MGVITEGISFVAKFLYGGQLIPRSWEVPLLVLGIYLIYLIISALILYYSIKIAGTPVDFMSGFPRALFTIFIRDLIILPLIVIAFAFPIIGIIFGIAVWLGLIKFLFKMSWTRALLAWIISLILPIVIALFILIPIAIILLF